MSDLDARKIRFHAVDFETTGRDPLTSRVTEIGVITYEDGQEVGRWGQLVNPGEEISEEVAKLTGITNELVQDCPSFGEVADTLVSLLEGEYFLAYNASYDHEVLRAEMGRLGRSVTLKGIIDPLPFAWKYLRQEKKTKNARLGTIAEYLGVSLENAHRATDDAAATAEVFLRLLEEIEAIPRGIRELLEVQEAFHVEMEESFQRFRRGPNRRTVSLEDVNLELGPAFVRGEVSDPLLYLFRRLPDVRDIR